MNTSLSGRFWQLLRLLRRDDGQDLVEYAMVVSIIALGAVSTMQTVAATIATLFTNLDTAITGV
jgi:pilus assembly protein Flp/PilA